MSLVNTNERKEETVKKTALYDWHQALGGKFVPFAGYQMPVWYTQGEHAGQSAEHLAVREQAGLFDVSHMGAIVVSGKEAEAFLQRVCSNDVRKCVPNTQVYQFICNELGYPLDDVMLSRIKKHDGSCDTFLLVANASNKEKILDWFYTQSTSYELHIDACFDSHAFLALQGPKAIEIASSVLDYEFGALGRFSQQELELLGYDLCVSRSGYTGEDGLEFLICNEDAKGFCDKLLDAGVVPCGLASRDSLRIEARMPLYGSEFSQKIHPLQSRFSWAVDFSTDFIGKEALVAKKEVDAHWRCVCFEMEQRIPRQGYPVFVDGKEVGVVTSATKSPLTGKVIGMALLDPSYNQKGITVGIDFRGKCLDAKLVTGPFY